MIDKDPMSGAGEESGVKQDSQIPAGQLGVSGIAKVVREVETFRVIDTSDTEGQTQLDSFARERAANDRGGFSIPRRFTNT